MAEEVKTEIVDSWERDGVKFHIKKISLCGRVLMDWHCGYCRFLVRPVREKGYGGILTYVPVHGGITFAEESDEDMVYGFDCAHAGDKENPDFSNLEWLHKECERMARAIRATSEYESGYLEADSYETRGEVLEAYHARLASLGVLFNLADNTGAMIRLMGGDL